MQKMIESPQSVKVPLSVFAWRNLWRNPRRTAILLLVFTLGIGTMLFFQSLMHAWSLSMLDNSLDNLTDPIQIHQKGYLDDPVVKNNFVVSSSLEKVLDSQPIEWTKRIRVAAMIQSEYESYPVTLIGIEPSREAKMSFIGDAVQSGQYLEEGNKASVLIGAKLAKRLQTKLKHRVVLMSQTTQDRLGEMGLKIQGIYQHNDPRVEESMIFVPYQTAQKLLQLKEATHEVAIKLQAGTDRQQLQSVQQALQQVAPTLQVETWWQLQPYIEASTKMMDSFIWVWLGFIMMLMVFGMLNTLMMSLYERQKEFVLLHTLGMKANLIRRLVLMEILWLVLVSTFLGLLLAAMIVLWGHDGVELTAFAEGAAWFGASSTLYLQFDAVKWIEVLAITLVVTGLFSLWPIYRSTRQAVLQIR